MFAPGQIHGMAIYYQVATGDMMCEADNGPRVELVDGVTTYSLARSAVDFRGTLAADPGASACVATTEGRPDWHPRGSKPMDWSLSLGEAPPGAPEIILVAEGVAFRDSIGENWVDLAAQGMRVRGQMPPPAAAA